MECCIIHCEKKATEFYKLREVSFCYCKRHTATPDKIIKNTKEECYGKNRGFGKLRVI